MLKHTICLIAALSFGQIATAAVSYGNFGYTYSGFILASDNVSNFSYGSIEFTGLLQPVPTLNADNRFAGIAIPVDDMDFEFSTINVGTTEHTQTGFLGNLSVNNPSAAGLDNSLDWQVSNNAGYQVSFTLDQTTRVNLEQQSSSIGNYASANYAFLMSTPPTLPPGHMHVGSITTGDLLNLREFDDSSFISLVLPAGEYTFTTSINVVTTSNDSERNSAFASSTFSVSFLAVPLPPAGLLFLSLIGVLGARMAWRK